MEPETAESKIYHRRSSASAFGSFLEKPFQAARKIGFVDRQCIVAGNPLLSFLSIFPIIGVGELFYFLPKYISSGDRAFFNVVFFIVHGGGFSAPLLFMFDLMKRGRGTLHLLRTGTVGYAIVEKTGTTGIAVNGKKEGTFRLLFKDKTGNEHVAVDRTFKDDEVLDDKLEQILYDATNPTNAALVDGIAVKLRVNATSGTIKLSNPFRVLFLVMPAIVSALIGFRTDVLAGPHSRWQGLSQYFQLVLQYILSSFMVVCPCGSSESAHVSMLTGYRTFR